MNVPSDLKYTKSHEWVSVDGGEATIGITDFAQSELGDIVYVDLPAAGRSLGVGDSFGTVESVKTVSDVYSPVSGEITAINENLGAQSELLNTDPYRGGWLVKIKLANPADVDALMDAATYEASLSS